MRYRDKKFYWSYQRGIHWPYDYLGPDLMTRWIMETSVGFTDVGLFKISESVSTYAYLILSSQASARSGIVGNTASALTAQSAFLNNIEDIVNRRVDIREDIKCYQDTLSYISSKVDYSIGESIYMLPSDMNLKIRSGTVGYNNKTLFSDGKFILGKNDEVKSLEAPPSAPQAETPVMKVCILYLIYCNYYDMYPVTFFLHISPSLFCHGTAFILYSLRAHLYHLAVFFSLPSANMALLSFSFCFHLSCTFFLVFMLVTSSIVPPLYYLYAFAYSCSPLFYAYVIIHSGHFIHAFAHFTLITPIMPLGLTLFTLLLQSYLSLYFSSVVSSSYQALMLFSWFTLFMLWHI